MGVKNLLRIFLPFVILVLQAHAKIDRECQFPSSKLSIKHQYMWLKTDKECKENCEKKSSCIVWQKFGNICVLQNAEARLSSSSYFVINNCKGGKPIDKAPKCVDNKGYGKLSRKLERLPSVKDCELSCSSACLVWQFNRRSRMCETYELDVLSTKDASVGIHYCNSENAIQSAVGTCKCGIENKNSADSRIINGQNITNPHQYPWQVYFEITTNETTHAFERCGGSIINNELILTAAHCFENAVNIDKNYDAIELWVGLDDIVPPPDSDVSLRVEKIHYPPQNQDFDNDIAIVQVDSLIFYTPKKIGPVCLPSSSEMPIENIPSIAIGWGQTLSGRKSSKLQEVTLNSVDDKECIRRFPWAEPLRKDEMCAYAQNKGTCLGDSGGPLMICVDNICTQTGVTSSNPDKEQGCSSNQQTVPSVFIRTTTHLKWIESMMKAFPGKLPCS